MRNYRRRLTMAATVGIAAVLASPVAAQKKYDPGASDTEIKIGNIMPCSGPALAYGDVGKTEAAYFRKVNSEGGINGRKIKFISDDDGYSPPKAVEQARKLVESDRVLLIFNPLGTPSNTAIQRYMNEKKCRSFLSRRAQRNLMIRSTSPGPWVAAELPERSAHLRPISAEEPPARKNRRPLSE
jgi:branched-chain amino acid transport system substrate-binding protein